MTTRLAARHDELMLSIGGIVGHLKLVGAPPVFLDQLRARYGTFEMPVAPRVKRDFSLRLNFVSAAPPRVTGRRGEVDAHPLAVKVSARAIAITRWDFGVRVSAGPRTRSRRFLYEGQGRCEMSPFSVDCILRVLWAMILPRRGGMLIHGCGLRHAEVGVVFPGPSGAGKSTLARKAPDADDVLSDELCVVRRADDGWRVYGTPFWGDFARGGVSMRSWPLRTLAFLAQAPRDTVTMTPMLSAEATLRLLGCFLAFTTDRATVEQNLALAARLCTEVRSVEASLTKNISAADIFRKLRPHFGPEATGGPRPANPREMISDFRALLRKHKSYASRSKGSRTWLDPGDSLFVQALPETELVAGDILLYWSPGASPEDDRLVCRRLVRRTDGREGAGPTTLTTGDAKPRLERFENRRRYEILGKVVTVSRDGTTRPIPGRLGNVARLVDRLVATPILNMGGR